jgi:hypothetical protein
MYRPVYIHWEWITDELIGGEHVQSCGIDYVKARRVACKSGWRWQMCNKQDYHFGERFKARFEGELNYGDCYDAIPEWSPCKPDWFADYDEYELEKIKIQNAVKRNHVMSYRERLAEDEKIKNFHEFPW